MTKSQSELTVDKALAFSQQHLVNLSRKFDVTDTAHDHSVRVGLIANYLFGTSNDETTALILSAGALHDVVEDTDVTIAEIAEQFGPDIAMVVDLLTHKETDDYFTYIAEVNNDIIATYVKIADIADNMTSGEITKSLRKRYIKALQMCLAQIADEKRTNVEAKLDIFMEGQPMTREDKTVRIIRMICDPYI